MSAYAQFGLWLLTVAARIVAFVGAGLTDRDVQALADAREQATIEAPRMTSEQRQRCHHHCSATARDLPLAGGCLVLASVAIPDVYWWSAPSAVVTRGTP